MVKTFLLLREGVDPPALIGKFPSLIAARFGESEIGNVSYHLQPLRQMHLHSGKDYEIQSEARGTKPLLHGDIQNVSNLGHGELFDVVKNDNFTTAMR